MGKRILGIVWTAAIFLATSENVLGDDGGMVRWGLVGCSALCALVLLGLAAVVAAKFRSMGGAAKAASLAGVGCMGLVTTLFAAFTVAVLWQMSPERGAETASVGTPERKTDGVAEPGRKAAAPYKADDFKESGDSQADKERKAGAKALHWSASSQFAEAAAAGDRKNMEKALALLEEAMRTDPENPRILMDLADAYVLMNDILSVNMAINIYQGLLEQEPDNDILLARLADASARISHYDEAFKYAARRTWSGMVSPVGAASQISMLAVASGDLERGAWEIRRILADSPAESEELKLMLASLLAEAGKKQEAAKLADEVAKSSPKKSTPGAVAENLKNRLEK